LLCGGARGYFKLIKGTFALAKILLHISFASLLRISPSHRLFRKLSQYLPRLQFLSQLEIDHQRLLSEMAHSFQHSDIPAVGATYTARTTELIYRHLRKLMESDDDINVSIEKIMADTHLSVGRRTGAMIPLDFLSPSPLQTPSGQASPGTISNTVCPTVSNSTTPIVSSAAPTTPTRPANCQNPRTPPQSYLAPGPFGSSPRPSSSGSSTPLIPRSGSPNTATPGQPNNSRPATPGVPATLFDQIKQWYDKRKTLEFQRYLQHMRYRFETRNQSYHNGCGFKDPEIVTVETWLDHFIGQAEARLAEKLANQT
jgi:hypothetical protein